MLPQERIDAYLAPLTEPQREAITAIRALLLETDPALDELIDEGKWFGGLLVYNAPSGMFLYALGPRAGGKTTFHMMLLYGSTELQEKHIPVLKKLMSGKSCIQFKTLEQVPIETLREIIVAGKGPMREKMEEMWRSRKR